MSLLLTEISLAMTGRTNFSLAKTWGFSNTGITLATGRVAGGGTGVPYPWGILELQRWGVLAVTLQLSSYDMSFTMSESGLFWYLCMHVGHAADGMYGSLVVA